MPITVTLFQHNGIAYDSGDISFGEGESKEIAINTGTQILKVNLTKPSVTLTARGCTGAVLAGLEAERVQGITQLLNGGGGGITINVLGKNIPNAVLTKVTPSAPITVNGNVLFESVAMEYQSQDYA